MSEDGGPAFPAHTYNLSADGSEQVGQHTYRVPGMTLREYFAGQVLAGRAVWRGLKTVEEQEECASECFSVADAMLKARNGE